MVILLIIFKESHVDMDSIPGRMAVVMQESFKMDLRVGLGNIGGVLK